MQDASKFVEAAEEDAREQGKTTKEYLEKVYSKAEAFVDTSQSTCKAVNRHSFTEYIKKAIRRKEITLVLGGKSVGKSFMLRHICSKLQAKQPKLNILLVNMRNRPRDLLAAILQEAAQKNDLRTTINTVLPQCAGLAVAAVAAAKGVAPAALPLANCMIDIVEKMSTAQEQQALTALAESWKEKGFSTMIIVDEANRGLPTSDSPSELKESAEAALAVLTALSKESSLASVLLVSSEYAFPYKLRAAGMNLRDIQGRIYAPEVPPKDMNEMFQADWSMGEHLSGIMVATYGGSISTAYVALTRLLMHVEDPVNRFFPLAVFDMPELPAMDDEGLRNATLAHLANIALDGFSPVEGLQSDKTAEPLVQSNLAGIITKSAIAVGLWKTVFTATKSTQVLVASSHHTRLLIYQWLLDKGHVDLNGVRSSPL